jgi:hypothetical protein
MDPYRQKKECPYIQFTSPNFAHLTFFTISITFYSSPFKRLSLNICQTSADPVSTKP